MPSTLFFNGRVIATPGSYSQVDASGLEQSSLSALGIVAIIGEGVGGQPVSSSMETSEFIRLNSPSKARRAFRSGDLREACTMIFEPSGDADIVAGAQEVVAMKVNQAVQAERTFSNAYGTAMRVYAQDYGEFTNQISIEHAAGTDAGSKLMTVTLEDVVEPADNVGGDDIFTLQYAAPAAGTGWDYTRAQLLNTGLKINAQRREVGLSGNVLNGGADAAAVIEVASDNIADTSATVTIYGLDVDGNPVRETLQLNGTTPTVGTQTWKANGVLGATLSASCAGQVDVQKVGGGVNLLTMATTVLKTGLVLGSTMFVANEKLSLRADGASTANVVLWGKSSSGAVQSEKVTLTGSTPVRTSGTWSEIEVIVLGELSSVTPRYVLISGTAVKSLNTAQDTLQKLSDFVNARQTDGDGFILTPVAGNLSFLIEDMDLTASAAPATNADPTAVLPTGTDIMTPAEPGFQATLKAMLDFYANSSELAEAERIDFSPKIVDFVITGAAGAAVSINGFTPPWTAGGTTALTAAAALAAINNDHRVNQAVVATQGATTSTVRVTALEPSGFVFSEGDANITNSTVQSTAGVGSAPADTSGPVFLSGGSEGTASYSDYQVALNLLKKVRVNSVVVLTGDPAVHAALDAHCAFMAGIGRSERDGFVGLSALTDDVPTNELPSKTSIKSQIVDINSRHIRAFAQQITRYNTAGERTDFLPWFQGVIAAGMQAGAPVGTSLTFKYANVLDVTQHSTWNPIDDSEEMILAGLCFMERKDGVGRRWVRNITTWLKTNNIAFSEASVNQAVNYTVFEFRTAMETAVGKRGFAGTVNAAKTTAKNKLAQLLDINAITNYRALNIELVVDVLDVSVELAPIISINFVKSTVHLTTVRQVA